MILINFNLKSVLKSRHPNDPILTERTKWRQNPVKI